MAANIEKILNDSELFKGLSDTAKKKIASMGTIVTINQNKMIFFEGEKGSSFYLLVEGSIRLFKSAPDGREITVKLAVPGEIFAEVILFEIDHYPVSATALSDSVLFSINRASFYSLLDNADFRNEFITMLMKKQRYLAGRIVYLTAYDVEERFFRFLDEHYGKHASYEISISKKDLAAAIGTIPETLSRLIQRLTLRGIIKWEGNRLELDGKFWDTQDYT
jgi:CRP-like cAMP-binding protein